MELKKHPENIRFRDDDAVISHREEELMTIL
jgi:hypothetical protein